jgi:PKD repeat protein
MTRSLVTCAASAVVLAIGCGGGDDENAPTAAFDVTCSSATCTFVDQSSDGNGSVTAWSWSFGDGAVSAERNPQHTYAVSTLTEFTVQLTVTDNDGARSVASRRFTVSPPTGLQCQGAAEALVGCTIALDRPARIEVELTDRECGAAGNSFTVTSPIVTTLFSNGCYEPPVGTVFTLTDNGNPFPAGTVIAAHMTSGSLNQVIPPSLVITGTASPWQVTFDDGENTPRDVDIVLTIRAIP